MFVEHKELGEVTEQPAKLEDWQRVLLKAANAIETHGHTKYDPGHPDRGFCFIGAIAYTAFGDANGFLANPWAGGLRKAFDKFGDAVESCPVTWNNRQERTKDEMVSKMRAVALGG